MSIHCPGHWHILTGGARRESNHRTIRHDWGDLFDAIKQSPDFKEEDFKCNIHLTWTKSGQSLYRRQLLCRASSRADLSNTLLSSSTATDTSVQSTSTSMPLSSQNKPEPAESSMRGLGSSSTVRTELSSLRSLLSQMKPQPSESSTRALGSSSTSSILSTGYPIDAVESPVSTSVPNRAWVILGKSTTHQERPTASYYSGNQVQGTCRQAVHPSASPNSGPLPPMCAKVNSKTGPLRINSSKARQAAQDFCHALSSEHVVLNAEHTAVEPWIVHGAAEHGGDLALSAIYDTQACSVSRQVELSMAGQSERYQNLSEYISQMCMLMAFLFPT